MGWSMLKMSAQFLTLIALSQSVGAVVVISGASNTSAPPGQPYFNNVGAVGAASGVYLGNRWVLTAAHVAPTLPTNATFGGITYATEADTFHRLANPTGSGLSTLTDIVLFRLGSDPGLPSLSISSDVPMVAADVMMIGRGRSQQATPSYWQVTAVPGVDNDIWTELTPPNESINAAGFKTTATQTLRWGENQINATSQTLSYGLGDVRTFNTVFNSAAKTHEAQAVAGDSGGAALVFDGVSWKLGGMMAAVSTFDNQPGGSQTAVPGNVTHIADLSFYYDGIMAVIPEPSSAILLALAGVTLSLRRQRSIPVHPGENP